MYTRAIYAEADVPSLQTFIRENPLGLLITSLQSPNFPLIQCTHLPWILDVPSTTSSSPSSSPDADKVNLGHLRGHIARANPQAKAMVEATRQQQEAHQQQEQEQHDTVSENVTFLDTEVTIMFNGPAAAYVTPKFYTATKPTTGKVVPTWNYSAVQATGRARVHFDTHDPATPAFLQRQIEDLTRHAETSVMGYDGADGRPGAWEVDDAPRPFVEVMKKAIVGVEVAIERLEGKWKMSQELGVAGDREGVVRGFREVGGENAERVAGTVEERGRMRDAERVKA